MNLHCDAISAFVLCPFRFLDMLQLVGRTVKELKFQSSYGGAVIAVHRGGRRVHELPSNIKLQAGDVLLLEAERHFLLLTKIDTTQDLL